VGESADGLASANRATHGRGSAIVSFRTAGRKPPLFLIHGVDGTVDRFQDLVTHLELDQPVYGVLSQALIGERSALMCVEDMARYYLQAIRAACPDGPYHFLGFSFGGLVAFEMAQQLHALGEPVGMLGMLDNLKMGSGSGSEDPVERENAVGRRRELVARHLKRTLSPQGYRYAKEKIAARGLRIIYTILFSRGKPVPRFLQRAEDINWFAAVNYVPRSYAGSVTLFQASGSRERSSGATGLWDRLAKGGVELKWIPGVHEDFLNEPHVAALAECLTETLASVRRTDPINAS
jgi:thioesterase domain-containing protein